MLIFKVLIIGDAAVGKTCLMNNYLGKPFLDHEVPTIGVEFGSRSEQMTDMIRPELLNHYRETFENREFAIDTNLKMHIWNSSGQERFHSIVTSYYRNAKGVILVCDLTRKHTLHNLETWISDFNQHSTTDISEVGAIIVGTKADLEDLREVYTDDLKKIAEKYHLPYFLVSSKKDRSKIERVFHNLANQMMEKFIKNPPDDPYQIQRIRVEKPHPDPTYSKWCCGLL